MRKDMSIKTWKERREGTAHSMEGAMLLEIAELRAGLDKLESDYTDQVLRAMRAEEAMDKIKKQEPYGSINKAHTIPREGVWCRSVLLYSQNNAGDSPERRVPVYLAAGAQGRRGAAELTDEDIDAVGGDFRGNYQDLRDFARAVLAAQKTK